MAAPAPGNLIQQLQAINNRLDQLAGATQVNSERLDIIAAATHVNSERLDIIAAASENNRIIARNSLLLPPQQYLPLLKTTPGHGLNLAQVAAQTLGANVQQGINVPAVVPAIGTVPPNFNTDLPNYRHADILQMIIFYNNDFGILPGDLVGSRVDKFRRFLSDF